MKPLDLEEELKGATPERLAKSLLAPKKRRPVKVTGAPVSESPLGYGNEDPKDNSDAK